MKCLKCSAVHQAAMFPPFLCPTCEKASAGENLAPYAEELTPIGPQLVIPGCERRPADNGKPVQLGLFG